MSKKQSKPADEADRFLAANPDIETVDALFVDLSGVMRGKRYPIAQLGKLMDGGIAFPGSVFLLDTAGVSHDPCGLGFSDGDPDSPAVVAPGTLKRVPWSDPPGAQVLLRFLEKDGGPFRFEPRTVAQRVLEQVHALGLRPVVAFELEFYLLDPNRAPDGTPQAPISPLTGQRDTDTQVYGMNEVDAYAGFLEEVRAACAVQDVPTGAISAEYAPGQFEINLQHLDDPLLAADHCVLFKRIVKGVARRHGLQATFMAKPYAENTGSGLHLHTSLLDKNGKNVFDGGKQRASATLKHALGGILAQMPDAMGIYAPNVNSYRRFKPNLFVAVRRSWDFENRSVALRIPQGAAAARRCCRAADRASHRRRRREPLPGPGGAPGRPAPRHHGRGRPGPAVGGQRRRVLRSGAPLPPAPRLRAPGRAERPRPLFRPRIPRPLRRLQAGRARQLRGRDQPRRIPLVPASRVISPFFFFTLIVSAVEMRSLAGSWGRKDDRRFTKVHPKSSSLLFGRCSGRANPIYSCCRPSGGPQE
jgi:glutamine synthetase